MGPGKPRGRWRHRRKKAGGLVAIKGGAIGQNPPRLHLEGPLSLEEEFQNIVDEFDIEGQIDDLRLEMDALKESDSFRVEEVSEQYRPATRYPKTLAAASVALLFVLGWATESNAPEPELADQKPPVVRVAPDPDFHDPGFIYDLEPEPEPKESPAQKQSAVKKHNEMV